MAYVVPIAYEFGSFIFNHKRKSDQSRYYHAHPGIELLYIYEGEGEVMLDGSHYPIGQGTLLWLQPYQLHLVDVPFNADIAYVRTNLTFDPHVLAAYLAPFPGLLRFYEHIWKGNLSKQIFTLQAENPLVGLLEEFQLVLHEPPEEREESFGLTMLKLLRLLQRSVFKESLSQSQTQSGPRALKHVETIMEWVEQHYRRPFRLDEIAEALFLSPYHLSHLFKASTGMTLSDHIRLRRVREACSLLANTSKPIQEIAAEVGGLSSSYFCQMFKRHKGVTPEEYRKTVRKA
ncbi:AraC family transcriptional regulator [Paenibacillus rhizovicinus]|uniref:AraC family transcriptional regulator n=1 Tax=Paenibacillus rhizovicinus TaxID=2704463 RepID=A0A6C0NZ03_9BACL|nr:AraC family transcriptional regulator [Paenibacillus rhizovicinus]QHW31166.1 AraC family transcriptional regulator [Paenibacillus rhizovicinus]